MVLTPTSQILFDRAAFGGVVSGRGSPYLRSTQKPCLPVAEKCLISCPLYWCGVADVSPSSHFPDFFSHN